LNLLSDLYFSYLILIERIYPEVQVREGEGWRGLDFEKEIRVNETAWLETGSGNNHWAFLYEGHRLDELRRENGISLILHL